jgi:type II secretory ATPase GspE/PulE/Tfp pilus assembly ATPase PilB-like protein
VLAGSAGLQRIDRLGFSASDVKQIKALFQKPYGIILIAGPTGSGKTTTLYAALREIDLLERNVLTVEDPVEYKLSLVKQSQVNEKAGYTYASAARSFMRQDPDVMLIGEIRDEDTAMISVRSAITGHLVLSTIHTNDAVTSVPRLLDLKVDKFLMSSALLAVIAQRLARKICVFCKTEYTLSDEERKIFEEHGVPVEKGYRGRGCEKCNGKGYAGRVVFAEVFYVDDEIKDLIFNNVPMSLLRSTAMKKGMCLIKTDGLIKAAQGVTTLDEVIRVSG